MTRKINPQAEAARESVRRGDGTFGTQVKDEAVGSLTVGESFDDVLDSLNPTGSIFCGYDPTARATAPLAANMTTLAETLEVDPDEPITVYRGVPRGTQRELNAGDFITTNEQLARDYAGGGDVITQTVRACDILDDRDDPLGEEYLYRPSDTDTE